MIYCNLKGGLGNIMFQIAAATSFAKDLKTTASFPNLLGNLTTTDAYYQNNCEKEIYEFLGKLNTEGPDSEYRTYSYPFHYEKKDLPLNCWVEGFFQSEKYFKKHRLDILELLHYSDETKRSLDKYSNILDNKTVSMHIRRGDFLKFKDHHPVLPIEYYKGALAKIGNYENILIFSDDIEWCKQSFTDSNTTFVTEKNYVSILLMSKCHANILANSSFSWWGAWLNTNENKQVVRPSIHFGNELSHLDMQDTYPPNWITN